MRRKAWVRAIDRYMGMLLIRLFALSYHLTRNHLPQAPPNARVLFIKFAGMGDAILLKPVVALFKRLCPDNELHFLTSPAILEVVQYLRLQQGGGIFVFDPVLCFKRPMGVVALINDLRKQHFDIVVDFEQWMRTSALLAFATGAQCRIGFKTPGQHRDALYTHVIPYSFTEHTLLSFARLASIVIGTDISALALRCFPKCIKSEINALATVRQKLASASWRVEKGPLVILHPGCGRGGEPRVWLPDRYAELVRRLIDMNVTVVLTGGDDDRMLIERIKRELDSMPVIDLAGDLSFAELVALVSSADLVVCPNTGIMHLAAAVGTPVIALHGPTNPAQWRPIGDEHHIIQSPLPCVPCLRLGYDYQCRDYPCMSAITFDIVWEAVKARL
ncbi:MAG TPA: glycosyltransferase family 9 protein [Armatimonadetes bacterium]|nr:glycosyltransferase family 9 protein [Armatimonadota bacterium]